jgi:hypothetical protein
MRGVVSIVARDAPCELPVANVANCARGVLRHFPSTGGVSAAAIRKGAETTSTLRRGKGEGLVREALENMQRRTKQAHRERMRLERRPLHKSHPNPTECTRSAAPRGSSLLDGGSWPDGQLVGGSARRDGTLSRKKPGQHGWGEHAQHSSHSSCRAASRCRRERDRRQRGTKRGRRRRQPSTNPRNHSQAHKRHPSIATDRFHARSALATYLARWPSQAAAAKQRRSSP